jgi:peroxiredoxin Q/BCP
MMTTRHSLRALVTAALIGASTLASARRAEAQTLKVGDMAPDFTVTTVTAAGVESKPFHLAEHRGETVVLAFFPKARTPGCTTQMESYRDQYAALFQGGRNVALVGVSTGGTSSLIAWAKDDKFPFRFAADEDKAVGKAYGASTILWHKRHLYVIDPAGKIAYIATPFLQMSADAYTALGKAVSAAGSTK